LNPRLRRIGVPLLVGLLAFLLALTWRGYRMELSVATGAAFALLAFVALRTVERMRQTLDRR
jgi:asparagine N-glycosylation enzyme membrane subunit Stt3